MYCQNTYEIGGWMKVVEKYYPANYGAPGRRRRKKTLPTPEDVKKHNEQLRIRKLQMLIAANFKEGDWHITLTYRSRDRPSVKESRKILHSFFARMRRAYRKEGMEFKWICVTETTRDGTPHHHLVIQDLPGHNTVNLIRQKWPYSNKVFCSSLDPDIESTEKGGADTEDNHGEYYGLADYLQKKESKEPIEEEDLQEGKKWSCRYSHSRNLIIPEPKREVIYRTRWVRIPKPEKGWYVSSLTNGINAYTQQPYQRYILRRLQRNRP
jgi:hypothetical protein